VAVDAAKLCGLSLDRVLLLESDAGKWSLKAVGGGADCWTDQRLTWQRVTDPHELEYSVINLLYSSGTTGVPKGTVSECYP
jgi:4-coumarate--CoA ligase